MQTIFHGCSVITLIGYTDSHLFTVHIILFDFQLNRLWSNNDDV